MQDHYGNKGPVLRLYAFKDNDYIALDKPADEIRKAYQHFLKTSQKILLTRLEELKEQLNSL